MPEPSHPKSPAPQPTHVPAPAGPALEAGPSGCCLQVHNRQRRLPVDAGWLQQQLLRVADREGLGSRRISIALVSDRDIRQLNRDCRGRDTVTDVLAFDYGRSDQAGDVDAEVVVSAQRAEAESRQRGLPADGELFLYCVHGLLHLAGYDDRRPAERGRMSHRQLEHLAEAGFPAERWQGHMEEEGEREES